MRRSDCSPHTALFGGYAELFHVLFRLTQRAGRDGFEQGEAGLRRFSETYGVLERYSH